MMFLIRTQAVHILRGRDKVGRAASCRAPPSPPRRPCVPAPLSLTSLLELAVWRGRPEDLSLLTDRLRSADLDDQTVFVQVTTRLSTENMSWLT